MKKFLKWFGIFLLLSIIFIALGPRPTPPQLNTKLPELSGSLQEIEQNIKRKEQKIKTLKKDNEARIIWFDSTQKVKTPYSLVYIHGFSASQAEGYPVHKEFAQKYGCNLYLGRLDGHGLDDPDAFARITPESLLNSAKEAVAVGQTIGEKVILMCTSTGATLGLYIASEHPEITALILYSPLIDFYDPSLWLLNKPWGLQLARTVFGGNYIERKKSSDASKQYWTQKYRLEGAVTLKSLIDATMNKTTFQKIKQPVFLGYYYRDEAHQDQTVSVKAMQAMYAELGTSQDKKRQFAFAKVGHHVIASYITSKDLPSVRQETFRFAEDILGLNSPKMRPKITQ
ncbi:MAG: alpha/beta hydrolase [Microscillaceae bacterium]|nr:alpha/beta hydrolase [Microscillaceae bacterium]